MRLLTSALVAGFMAAGAANAADLNFATGFFDDTFGPISSPFVDSLTIDGIDFGFAAESGGANGFRQSKSTDFTVSPPVTTFEGLQFGIPGNGMVYLDITASVDLMIESLTGFDFSNLDADTDLLPFDLLVDGSSVATGGAFSQSGSVWDFADFSLTAGSTLRIIEQGPRNPTTGGRIDPNAGAVIGSMQYSTGVTDPTTPVPLPAGLPLLLAGLGALGLAKRRLG